MSTNNAHQVLLFALPTYVFALKLLVWPTMLYVTELKQPDDDAETVNAIDAFLQAAGDGRGGGHQILRDREGKPEYMHWDIGCCA